MKVLALSDHCVNGALLDLGCGEGLLAGKFRQTGVYTVGIDRNKVLVRSAKKRVHDCEFLVADGCSLPFADAVFKTVVMNDVLEHISYAHGVPVMNEACRTLTADGKIYTSVMNRWQFLEPHLLVPFMTWFPKPMWNTIYRLKMGKKTGLKYTDAYFPYTKKQLSGLFRNVGLTTEDYTWVYASDKVLNPEQIGSPTLRTLAKILKALKLHKLTVALAEKSSVLVFVCWKH